MYSAIMNNAAGLMPHVYRHFEPISVLVRNEMVLVLVLDLARHASTSTDLRAEFEHEHEHEHEKPRKTLNLVSENVRAPMVAPSI